MRIKCLYFLTLFLALRRLARKKLNNRKLMTSNCASIVEQTSGLMCGTTPPWEITTSPRSLFNLSRSLARKEQKKFIQLTLHHFGWQAVSAEGRYAASCCPVQHCQPTPKSLRRDTRGQQQDRLRNDLIRKSSRQLNCATYQVHLHPRAGHSCHA